MSPPATVDASGRVKIRVVGSRFWAENFITYDLPPLISLKMNKFISRETDWGEGVSRT